MPLPRYDAGPAPPNRPLQPPRPLSDSPRVAAVFGLTLLQTLRDQDQPSDLLEDEDPTVTLPRRLGVSRVVEQQIRVYQEAVRRKERMSDAQVLDLVRLVVRRPDAAQVFARAGWRLAGGGAWAHPSGTNRFMPRGLALAATRRSAARGLKRLFGRTMGHFDPTPFGLEGRGLLFYQADPSGQACQFLSGYCEAVVRRRLGDGYAVVHGQCQAQGDPTCRWTMTGEARRREADGVREMLLRPEPEMG